MRDPPLAQCLITVGVLNGCCDELAQFLAQSLLLFQLVEKLDLLVFQLFSLVYCLVDWFG
jgi:hypothetical protein